jgi:tripeptide aminopeptidase
MGGAAEDRVIETFLEMAPIHGPSKDEGAVAAWLQARLDAAGIPWRMDGAGERIGGTTGNLIADIPASPGREGERLAFSAHMDVVPPGCCSAPAIRDGYIVSEGDTVLGTDDRAGVAAILVAAEGWAAGEPHPAARLIFCVSEETHLEGSRALDDDALEGCDLAYVVDSATPVGNLVVETPTCSQFEAAFEGWPAHAGICPEEGRSAVQMAARAIDRMRLGRLDEDTTANVGLLEGGSAGNVVPAAAKISGECRSFRHETVGELLASFEAACREAAEAFGGKAHFRQEEGFRAYRHARGDVVLERAWNACERAGFEPMLGRTGGGSDANTFNERGVPAINLGTGITGNHTPDEKIAVTDLQGMVRILRAIADGG